MCAMAVFWLFLFAFSLLQIFRYTAASSWKPATTPPLPILPLPSASQLKWQQREIIMFHHFGVNTFTDSEWGTGHEDPAIFNPTALNANQWVDAAVEAGVSLMILTAKHHDGFCLWPSKYTDHSVISSPWKDGKGDVVREFVDAASKRGVDVGLYLSPWDRHEKRYGHEIEYNEYYLGQLQELLNRNYKAQSISFSDAGLDVRWVGNEKGYAGRTCWSTINRTLITIGGNMEDYLNKGDPRGTDWLPAECDVSIRTGWFWHKNQTAKPLSHLLNIFYKSVGRNCVLLLNVPPNTMGLLSANDVLRLREFREAIDTIFTVNYAEGSNIKASSQRGTNSDEFGTEKVVDDDHLWSYWAPGDESNDQHWIEFVGKGKILKFNVVRIQEAIGLGQRIKQHEVYADGKLIAKSTTIGYKRLHRLDEGVIYAHRVRIVIKESGGLPLISSIGLHFDPFWHPK
ncbi:hypothetical protein IFM89_014019 [Coptis chinensis]|uniref:alpha-L-fucosidase n=1 Tax=Coptis chinensis TaxID=261450 RepID=A0A835IBU9_9MAGN|nr:hypothetical protein IFM89_014019 [Coptis chinensis]